MKFASVAAAVLAFALPVVAQTEGISNDASEGASNDASEGASSDASEGASNDASESVSNDTPGGVSYNAPESASYDPTYDNPSLPLMSVACSNGVNGLIAKGYTTLGSLPNFPNVGGVYTTSWDSPACGTCYEISYGDLTIPVLAVDVALDGFNLSEETMNILTGGLGVELGRVEVTAVEVDASVCGI